MGPGVPTRLSESKIYINGDPEQWIPNSLKFFINELLDVAISTLISKTRITT